MKKLLTEWREFLEEEREFEKQASRGEIVVSSKKLSKVFRVFHLSTKKLEKDGDFDFTPRVPAHPWEDGNGSVTEDDFTKRISLAPTIEKAVEALGMGDASYFVYAGDIKNISTDDIKVTPLKISFKKCKKDLSIPGNKYGLDFSLSKWKKKVMPKQNLARKPSQLEPELRKKFYACVPDALSSDEMWSLDGITLYRIGEYLGRGQVELSPVGVQLIEKYKVAKNEKTI